MHELPLEKDGGQVSQQVFSLGEDLVEVGGGVLFVPGDGAAGLGGEAEVGASRGEAQQPFKQLHSIGEIKDWVRARASDRFGGAAASGGVGQWGDAEPGEQIQR